MTLNRDFK